MAYHKGSILAPLFVILAPLSKKFAYTKDVEILLSYGQRKKLERTLSQNMITLFVFPTGRLKLSHAGTIAAAFHIPPKANCELMVCNISKIRIFFEK